MQVLSTIKRYYWRLKRRICGLLGISVDVSIELKTITLGRYDKACEILGLDPEKVRSNPQAAYEGVEVSTEQMQAFCEHVLKDFEVYDIKLPEMEAAQGWAFFIECFSLFLSEVGSTMKTLKSALLASLNGLECPDGRQLEIAD